jgi:hypothetical protein
METRTGTAGEDNPFHACKGMFCNRIAVSLALKVDESLLRLGE